MILCQRAHVLLELHCRFDPLGAVIFRLGVPHGAVAEEGDDEDIRGSGDGGFQRTVDRLAAIVAVEVFADGGTESVVDQLGEGVGGVVRIGGEVES